MLQSIRSLPAHFSHLETYTISETLDTDTRRSSIVPLTPLHDNHRIYPTSKRPPKTRRRGSRKMNTGQTLTHRKKTEWDVAATVTQISVMSKARREVALRNG